MPTPDRDPFADWLEGHAVRLAHLDPEAPLDDLEPLRDFIGDARVVAVGENSHFIDEFSMLRRRILRFLAERCGFTVLAFEYGFSEGFPLDDWARGEGTEGELTARVGTAIPIGVEGPLRWIRHHNRTVSTPVRFAGIDIPAAGGSLLPALEPVAAYLREIDPETLPEAEAAIEIGRPRECAERDRDRQDRAHETHHRGHRQCMFGGGFAHGLIADACPTSPQYPLP